MTGYERTAWIMLVTTIPAYIIYAVIVVTNADGGPLHEADYVWPALITIGAVIVANILLGIIAGIVAGMLGHKDAAIVDERDRTIEQLGERVGSGFIVVGGIGAMLMAMAEWDWFWIANLLLWAFFASGVASSIAKVSAHRWGLQ